MTLRLVRWALLGALGTFGCSARSERKPTDPPVSKDEPVQKTEDENSGAHSGMAPTLPERKPISGPITGRLREFENHRYCRGLADVDAMRRLFQEEMDYEERPKLFLDKGKAVCFWGSPDGGDKRPVVSAEIDCVDASAKYMIAFKNSKRRTPSLVKPIKLGEKGFAVRGKNGAEHTFLLPSCLVKTKAFHISKEHLDAFANEMASVLGKKKDIRPIW